MFLAVTTVGFILMTLGVAMLLVGEVPFLGKRIPARHSRLMGSILVLFLPLALAAGLASSALFGEGVHGPVVTWTLFALCVLASLVILIHALMRKETQRPEKAATPPKQNPFGEVEEVEEVGEVVLVEPAPVERPASKQAAAKKPAAAKRRTPPAQERDPFDFS